MYNVEEMELDERHLAELLRCLGDSPLDPNLNLEVAQTMARLKKSNYIDFYIKSIEFGSRDMDAMLVVSSYYVENKMNDSALSVLREAENLFPEIFELNSLLGQCLFRVGEVEDAAFYLRKALLLNPSAVFLTEMIDCD